MCALLFWGSIQHKLFWKEQLAISSILNIASLNIYVHSCVWTDVLVFFCLIGISLDFCWFLFLTAMFVTW